MYRVIQMHTIYTATVLDILSTVAKLYISNNVATLNFRNFSSILLMFSQFI